MKHAKYPRTPHLPFSPGATSDDIQGDSWDFDDVIITEKMDGENTTFYSDGYHARSIDSNYHESRSWAAATWAQVRHLIPDNRRIILENLYARHSIAYGSLPHYLAVIGVVDDINGTPTFLSWEETEAVAAELGIPTVPVLYRGTGGIKKAEDIFLGLNRERQEGVVIRSAGRFAEDEFLRHVGKAVREGHVTTDDHWSRAWVPNTLARP